MFFFLVQFLYFDMLGGLIPTSMRSQRLHVTKRECVCVAFYMKTCAQDKIDLEHVKQGCFTSGPDLTHCPKAELLPSQTPLEPLTVLFEGLCKRNS